MLELNVPAGQKVCELGGGANPRLHPNIDLRQCYDPEGRPTVDIPGVDFNEPFGDKLQSDEWDAVLCQYALEHISYRRVPQFLKEVLRILKNGGKAVFVVPNTSAQLEWIAKNPSGWDGKDAFDSCSCVLYGDQDYPENTHKCFWNPEIAKLVFEAAGFSKVTTHAYGERDTDMVIQAVKPVPGVVASQAGTHYASRNSGGPVSDANIEAMPPEEKYDKAYFNGGGKVGGYAREGYWDYPVHEVTARHVLARKPESVLELGCARGYILKRIQDAGIPGMGVEVSKHCWMTRACENVINGRAQSVPDGVVRGGFDLCYSVAFLEHIPERELTLGGKECTITN